MFNSRHPDFQGMVIHANSFDDLMKKIEMITNNTFPTQKPDDTITSASINSTDEIVYKYIVHCGDNCYTGIVKAQGSHIAIDLINQKYPGAVGILEPIDIPKNSVIQIDSYTIVND